MAIALDVRQKQRAVIEFLRCENETVENTEKRLKKCMEMTLSIAVHFVGGMRFIWCK